MKSNSSAARSNL